MKRISLLIIFTMMISIFSVHAEKLWDGYESDGEKTVVVDMNSVATIINAKLGISTQYTKTAAYSALWNNHTNRDSVNFEDPAVTDWTNYTTVEFEMYSPKPVAATFAFIVFTEAQTASGPSYFMSDVQSVSWSGWKTFKFNLSEFTANRAAVWDKVTYVNFSSGGWTMTPNAETELYIDSIYLSAGEEESSAAGYCEYSRDNAAEVLENGIGVYENESKVMTKDGLAELVEEKAAKTFTDNGVFYVPAGTLSRIDGTEYIHTNKEMFTFNYNENTLNFSVGSAEYTLNGEAKSFSGEVKCKENVCFVPFEEFAEALGLKTYKKGGLHVAAKATDALEYDPESAEYIAAQIKYKSINVKDITEEDYRTFRDRWNKVLCGDETIDLENEAVATEVKAREKRALAVWNLLDMYESSGSNPFTGKDPTDPIEIASMASSIGEMAYGWGTYGTSMYHDPEWKDRILTVLEYFCNKYFSAKELNGTGAVGTNTGNWYYWQISAPTNLVNIMVIMYDYISPRLAKKYLVIPDTLVYSPRGTSSNRVHFAYVAMGSALLQRDAQRIVKCRDGVTQTMLFVNQNMITSANLESTDGFYRDGSMLMHYRVPYNGGYGVQHYEVLGQMLSVLKGTPFEPANPSIQNLFDFFFAGMDSVIYNGVMMDFVRGRSVIRPNTSTSELISGMMYLIEYASEEEQAIIKSKIKQYAKENGNITNPSTNLQVLNDYYNIINDTSVSAAKKEDTYTVHYNMDKTVLKRKNFAIGISMSSPRVYNYEAMNGENLNGWYCSDGMVYLYTDDNNAFGSEYFNNVNSYRYPGITVEARERNAIEMPAAKSYLSSKDFVGGVTDGVNGAAAMDLESYHKDGSDGVEPYICDLTAKKSWFMLGDKMAVLGTDIHATDDYDVETVIENRKSRTTVSASANSAEQYEIKEVTASDEPQPENPISAAVDGNLQTRWSAGGNQWLKLDLGENKKIGMTRIAFMNGNVRKTMFDINVSADGNNWKKVFSGASSGTESGYENFALDNAEGRYIRFDWRGNTQNEWNSILEIQVFGMNKNGSKNYEFVYTGQEKVIADGTKLNVSSADLNTKAKWVWYESTGGYVFENPENINMRRTTGNPSFFEMWINHGKKPDNAKYAYVQLPLKSAEEVKAYSENPTVKILSNTEKLQAAADETAGLTEAVFWSAGALGRYSVDVPMMFMEQKADGKSAIAVSDPTQKLTSGRITVEGVFTAEDADDKISVTNDGAKTYIDVDFTGSYGRSFKVTLR